MTGWKLEGISQTAREAAKAAARREKIPLGDWLNQLIEKAAGGRPKGPKGASESDPD